MLTLIHETIQNDDINQNIEEIHVDSDTSWSTYFDCDRSVATICRLLHSRLVKKT